MVANEARSSTEVQTEERVGVLSWLWKRIILSLYKEFFEQENLFSEFPMDTSSRNFSIGFSGIYYRVSSICCSGTNLGILC